MSLHVCMIFTRWEKGISRNTNLGRTARVFLFCFVLFILFYYIFIYLFIFLSLHSIRISWHYIWYQIDSRKSNWFLVEFSLWDYLAVVCHLHRTSCCPISNRTWKLLTHTTQPQNVNWYWSIACVGLLINSVVNFTWNVRYLGQKNWPKMRYGLWTNIRVDGSVILLKS